MSLSEKNKNPLNIRATVQNAWEGQVGINKGFAVFKEVGFGYRAAIYLMLKYMVSYKLITPAQIIRRWAPPNENKTEEYIRVVCKRSEDSKGSLRPNKPITKWSELVELLYAMTEVEGGRRLKQSDLTGFLRGIDLCYEYPLPSYLKARMSKMVASDDKEEV